MSTVLMNVVLGFIALSANPAQDSVRTHLPTARPAAICNGDTAVVRDFVNRFVANLPPALRVPRGAFVLACGGHPEVAVGFGKTASGIPVDPARTIFRAASNSKLIAATAVLQLAERGQWKLTDDVNQYLPEPAKLRSRSQNRPVTLAALLTHTSGLENKFAGGVTIPAKRVSLAEFFSHPPQRAQEPGFEVSYSNVGMALAGYLVEARSRESFARYAEKNIFAPLGMLRSSFDQPPPSAWIPDLADGLPRGNRDVVFHPYPAASLVTTPVDMGRFIAAHLNGGALDDRTGGGRMLSVSATALMHASHWRAHPEVPGVAYGFFEGKMNGRRTLFHTGDSGDHSVVFLLPDESVGFYFVYNGSDGQSSVRETFVKDFLDRFFPDSTVRIGKQTESAAVQPVTEFLGAYRTAAYSRSNYEKVQALFAQVLIREGDKGGIAVLPPGAPQPIQLHPYRRDVFRSDSGEVVVFRRDAKGAVVGLTVNGSIWDPTSWDRVGLLEDGRFHRVLFAVIGIAALLRLIFWPVAALIRRLRGRQRPVYSETERRYWRFSGVASALLILSPVAGLATALLSFTHPAVAIPRAVFVVECGVVVATVVGLMLVPMVAKAWRQSLLTPGRRIHLSVLAGAFIVLAPMLVYWRLLPIW